MDAHTHLAFDVEAEKQQSESTAFRALRAVKAGQHLVQAGFTTVRDLGNEGHHALTDVRRAFTETMFPGPTLLHAGKAIAPFGGQSRRRHPIPFERGVTWAVDYADADARARMWSEKIIQRLRLAHEVGTPLAFGTDVAFTEPGRTRAELMFDYLSVWKAAGIPPWETLRAMTVNAAGLLGLSKERGTLRVGQYADLVAVKKNPLEDLESLRSIHFVMKEGQVVRFDR